MNATHARIPPHLTPLERGRLERLLERLTAEPRLTRVVVFGSRARGHSKEDSDLDLAIHFASPRSRDLERRLTADYKAMSNSTATTTKTPPGRPRSSLKPSPATSRNSFQRWISPACGR